MRTKRSLPGIRSIRPGPAALDGFVAAHNDDASDLRLTDTALRLNDISAPRCRHAYLAEVSSTAKTSQISSRLEGLHVEVVFARRQSPDWCKISRIYRDKGFVLPDYYIPDHKIEGFPGNIEALIGAWNARFAIDFFTYRAVMASISRENVSTISNSVFIGYHDTSRILSLRGDEFIYFYDDDDIFSPDMAEVISQASPDADAVVTPLFRIGVPSFTFVRSGSVSDIVIGDQRDFHFRYQTNNYGINARRCRMPEQYYALKDHVVASAYAQEHAFTDEVLPRPISATIKTPGSASMMPITFADADSPEATFDSFIREQREVLAKIPSGYEWLAGALDQITQLCELVVSGRGYIDLEDIPGLPRMGFEL